LCAISFAKASFFFEIAGSDAGGTALSQPDKAFALLTDSFGFELDGIYRFL
jgi:hypothetical protein